MGSEPFSLEHLDGMIEALEHKIEARAVTSAGLRMMQERQMRLTRRIARIQSLASIIRACWSSRR